MLIEEHMQTVLISATPEPTGHERLVMAFREGDDLYIPLDETRPGNSDLFQASQIYVRESDRPDEYAIYEVAGHQPLASADRERLERNVHNPISVSTEVLHIRGVHVAFGALHREPPGFIALLDGSEGALRSLAPARALADWYGRVCTVIEVTADGDDQDTDSAVSMQLEDSDFGPHDIAVVAKRDLDAALFEWMRQGQIVVASATGVAEFDGRLHGTLNRLVQRNAPAIIGIGPNVAADWTPNQHGPIIVCVDATEHAHHVVDKLEPFLCPSRGSVVVAHFETESPADNMVASTVADAINRHFGIPTRALSAHDDSAAAGIAILASREQAQLVITHSWHRPAPGVPTPSSTSLSAVAHAPCPVVILGE